MPEELENRIEALENWKKSLERSSSIPLPIDQAFRERFGLKFKILVGTATLDFGSIAANASASLDIPVTGASPGDAVAIGFPLASTISVVDGNRIFVAYVSAPNVVTLYLTNKTAGALDVDSGVFTAYVIKKQ